MDEQEYLYEIKERYNSQGYEVHLIPRNTIRHLRGCLWCLDLNHENIDTVAICARADARADFERDSKSLYMFEYALRGNINDIPPDRKILTTESKWKGILNKKIQSIKWIIPEETENVSRYQRLGAPPRPGEIWETGPHMFLTNALKKDKNLIMPLMELTQNIGDDTLFTLYTDEWGESIRLACSAWRKDVNALRLYTSPEYLEATQGLFKHVQAVRKRFGGLTF